MLTIKDKMLLTESGGMKINASIPCNTENYAKCDARTVEYVAMHYTGVGYVDNPKSNCTYFANGSRAASAHYFVDDTSIYQSVDPRDRAWAVGKNVMGRTNCTNYNSISIEMCCTAGKFRISEKTKENAARLAADLLKKIGYTSATFSPYLVRHYDVSGKQCPAEMVPLYSQYMEGWGSEEEWERFKALVKSYLYADEHPQHEQEEEEMRYQTIEELPKSLQPEAQELVERGFLAGTGNGLDVTLDMIRCMIVMLRAIKNLEDKIGRKPRAKV